MTWPWVRRHNVLKVGEMEGAPGRVGGEQRRVLAEELGALSCHGQTLGVMGWSRRELRA